MSGKTEDGAERSEAETFVKQFEGRFVMLDNAKGTLARVVGYHDSNNEIVVEREDGGWPIADAAPGTEFLVVGDVPTSGWYIRLEQVRCILPHEARPARRVPKAVLSQRCTRCAHPAELLFNFVKCSNPTCVHFVVQT